MWDKKQYSLEHSRAKRISRRTDFCNLASPSIPNKRINDAVGDENKSCDGRPKSKFQKTVCLKDWWLVKAGNDSEGSGLAVAGFTYRERQAMRVFSSAPIHKRHDVFTLETTDGICVIIKGFINKARTAENGFPSDVFDHFVFGFPPYWKEYAEKCIVAGGQSHVDSDEREVGSQDTMGAKGLRKSNRTASSVLHLPPQYDSVASGNDNAIVSSIVPEGLEKKFYSRESTSDDQMTPNMPVYCLDKKSLKTSRLVENAIIPAVIEKDADDPQNISGGILSACCLYNESRGTKSAGRPRKVKSDQKNSIKSKFNGDMSLPDWNISHTKSRETTVSLGKLERKHKNDQTSCLILGGVKSRSKSVLSEGSAKVELASVVDREPQGSNNFHSEAIGLKETADKMNLRELNAGFVKETFELIAETLNQVTDLKTKGSTEKAKVRVMSENRPATADNEEHATANKRNASESDATSAMKPRRKLTYETPGTEKGRVHSGSPPSLGFNRSRSGRLLMPTLEFWRNQRALYDADGTVTGIEEEIHLEQSTRGSRSTSQRKRRKLV